MSYPLPSQTQSFHDREVVVFFRKFMCPLVIFKQNIFPSHLQWHFLFSDEVFTGERAGQPVNHIRSTNSKQQSNQFQIKIKSSPTFLFYFSKADSLGYTSQWEKSLSQLLFHANLNMSKAKRSAQIKQLFSTSSKTFSVDLFVQITICQITTVIR